MLSFEREGSWKLEFGEDFPLSRRDDILKLGKKTKTTFSDPRWQNMKMGVVEINLMSFNVLSLNLSSHFHILLCTLLLLFFFFFCYLNIIRQ